MHYWLMNTCAWRTLDPVARATLIELYRLYDGQNNGAMFCSTRQLADWINVHRNTANRALWELERRGFIRAKDRSGYDYKATEPERRATTWILTEFPHGAANPTKDFMQWREGDDFMSAKTRPRVKYPVPPQGQTVPPQGQRALGAVAKHPGCPSTGTDKPENAALLSLHRDSGNYHARAAEYAASEAMSQAAAAALASRLASQIPRISIGGGAENFAADIGRAA